MKNITSWSLFLRKGMGSRGGKSKRERKRERERERERERKR